jgi:hypothetical protein
MMYLNHRNRTLSPPGEVHLSTAKGSVDIFYSRPSVRERLIFGTKEQGALVPYGEYWRLGANESTEIETTMNFEVGGTTLDAGRYKIYAIPREDSFEIRFSKDIGNWGYSEPDYSLDVAKHFADIETLPNITEQFTISGEETTTGVLIYCDFDQTRIIIPIFY